MTGEWEAVTTAGAALGEGPHWDGSRLWWVDIERGYLHRTDIGAGADDVFPLGEVVGAVVPRAGGGFVACFVDGVGLHGNDGREQRRIAIEPDDHESRLNDAKCDPAGRLFTGTMTFGAPRSSLYRVSAGLRVEVVAGEIGISNGLGWSPDASLMYYTDSATRRVDVFEYDLSTGECDRRRPLIELDEAAGFPDGLCVDADGCVWVACWTGWEIRRYSPHGELMRTIELPVSEVTSCAFGGTDLDRLFVTSASGRLTAAERSEQPHAGAVFEVDPGCKGQASVPFGA